MDNEHLHQKKPCSRNDPLKRNNCARVDQSRSPGKKDEVHGQRKLMKVVKEENVNQLACNVQARSAKKGINENISKAKAANVNYEKEGDDESVSEVQILDSAAFQTTGVLSSFVPSKRFDKSDDDSKDLGGPSATDEFRKHILKVLKMPYNKEEHDRLREAVQGSYLNHYPDLGKKLEKHLYNRRKCLAILRGFFFWLQNVVQEGALDRGKMANASKYEETGLGRLAVFSSTMLPSFSYCNIHRVDFGFSMLAASFKLGHMPDEAMFSPLLKGLFRENRIAEAQQLFRKIVREGLCEVNNFVFGVVVDGLCKAGNTAMAIELLRVMQKGSRRPGTHEYNMIIDSLCKDRLVDSAMDLFDEMPQKGITRTVVTYTTLINGLSTFSRWEEVKALWKQMIDCNIYPNVITFNTVIDALCKEGLVDKAHEVLNIMILKNHVPDVSTYGALMDGYCLQGRVEEARKIFNSMPGKGITPCIISYGILINGYFKKTKIDEAMHLFREMPLKGLEPDVVTYNTVLQGLFRLHKCSTALEIFDEMLAANKKPNFYTYCNMLNGLYENGLAERAWSLLDEIEKKGLTLHICYYTIVIDGLCKANKLDTARALFADLPSKGLKPDVITYTAIINGCCEKGLLEEAKDILLKMEQRSCIPNRVTYNVIFRGILKSGDLDEAAKFLDVMVGRGFSPDGSTASSLFSLLQKKENNPNILNMIKKCAPTSRQSPGASYKSACEGVEPDEATIMKLIRKGTISSSLVPVLCGSAFKNNGVHPLLDAVIDYLPSPIDLPPMKGTDPDDPELISKRGASDDEPFAGLAFKIMSDPFVGSLTIARVYAGMLAAGSYVLNANKGKKEKIGRLLEMHANSREDIKIALTGKIVALADPVIKVAIEPKTKADIDKMAVGLIKLDQEDPSFHFSRDEEINQTVIEGMGELYLEIIVER
ncbi:hypothetical protein BUALT_Bualt05G0056700 [Buddleja alternifolia]|uniref:Elongation Factor G domain-containing protein n=1 Tax=Buddleja alternifolia TaxID=168488 RepID=A0AAV6XGZ6_9LAMI|nr:hypothetical protein BUALT_Bualt05G0056700 [Buddleja alternifolia]